MARLRSFKYDSDSKRLYVGGQAVADASSGSTPIVSGNLSSNTQTSITSVGTLGNLSVVGNVSTGTLTTNGAITTSDTLSVAGIVYANSSVNSTHNTNGALVVVGGMGVGKDVFLGGNLTVTGNLFVNGNTTIINANNVNVNDSMIYLADSNPGDTLDIGIVSSFTNAGYQHTGFVRDHDDGIWKLFAGVTIEPTTEIDFTNATYSTIRVGNIYAGGTTANDNRFLQSTASGLAWTAATSISSGTTSATASSTTLSIVAQGVAAAEFNHDIAYIHTSLDVDASILVEQDVIVTGNVEATYIIGDGSQLTGLPEGYANVQVATYLPIYGGEISVGNITTTSNSVANIGSTSNRFRTVHARATQAQYADLAENYTSDQNYAPGTVLVFGGSAEVMQSHSSHDTRIAGVVSTDPAYLMNSTLAGVSVALTGRVPCQVLGPIEKGDRVVSSHIAGTAQRLDPLQYQPGCIIGKALEDHPEDTVKTIEVVVGRV